MRSDRSLVLGLGLGLLAACSDTPAGQPEPQPFVVENADVWSGTSVTVRSAGFVAADPSAVLLGTDTLVFTRVNDSTLTVALPDLPGTHQLRIVSASVLTISVSVHLNGYLDSATGPVFSGRVVRGASLTDLYGSGPFGLRRWNVSTGQTFDYPDSMHISTGVRGVGIGSVVGELVLHSAAFSTAWRTWKVEPGVERRDSAPVAAERFLDVLTGGVHVSPGGHEFRISWCDTTCQILGYPRGESGFEIVHSPVGNRAALLAYTVSDSGAPVIDADAKRVLYVTPFRAAMGAAFSQGGDTLFLVGQDHSATAGGAGLVAVVRGADGARLSLDTTSYAPCGVAIDPGRPLLYVAGIYYEAPNYWSVLGVFDRATLDPIVTLRVADGPLFGKYGPCTVLPSPLERRVYVVTSFDAPFDPAYHVTFARFETPP
jgi:hypothetical protein